jgi:SsrA-binding protein
MSKKSANELVSNRKARHNFEILETIEAGICLVGTEIKSLRDSGGSLQDAYVDIKNDEAWLINSSIAPYKFGNVHNHEDRRKRKLLLHKKEIEKLHKQQKEKGIAIVALSMYLSKGKVKVRIATAKGKKLFDKRSSIKEKEQKRRISRALKQN